MGSKQEKIICPTCKQDMIEPPHRGLAGRDCPQCGQGLSWRRAARNRRRAARIRRNRRKLSNG